MKPPAPVAIERQTPLNSCLQAPASIVSENPRARSTMRSVVGCESVKNNPEQAFDVLGGIGDARFHFLQKQ